MRSLNPFSSPLRLLASLWVCLAIGAGILAAWVWAYSDRQWQKHLDRAYDVGNRLYETLYFASPPPDYLDIRKLEPAEAKLAQTGRFTQISGVANSSLVTQFSITGDTEAGGLARIVIAVVSPDLSYPVAELNGLSEDRQAEASLLRSKLAEISILLASYCSTPSVYLRFEEQSWIEVRAEKIWNCSAAPTDLRLISAAILLATLFLLWTAIASISSQFSNFSSLLASRSKLGGPVTYAESGPLELRELIRSINGYLQSETESLARRAKFLVGVSHDLGTPATRLRLRARLVQDPELRGKIDADIEQMTGMIESVLAYTQTEINIEAARQLSLVSLVESIVSDFQDEGMPVSLQEDQPRPLSAGTILFVQKKKRPALSAGPVMIIVTAQPQALRRAITNLIDNALKYGRRAHLSIEQSSQYAAIHIDDFGLHNAQIDINSLIDPFKRGENSSQVKGFGIGLSVASTIAEQHGGRLEFSQRSDGLRASLVISRTMTAGSFAD